MKKINIMFLLLLFLLSCTDDNKEIIQQSPKKEKMRLTFGAEYPLIMDCKKHLNILNSLFENDSLYCLKTINKNINTEFLRYKIFFCLDTRYNEDIYSHIYSIESEENWLLEYPSYDNYHNLISIRQKNNKYNAFYIKWYNIHNYELAERKGVSLSCIPRRDWWICEATDTIFTNIDTNFVKALFPDFIGKIYYKTYKEIIIDYSISPEEKEFYKRIKFVE